MAECMILLRNNGLIPIAITWRVNCAKAVESKFRVDEAQFCMETLLKNCHLTENIVSLKLPIMILTGMEYGE